jgi:hypothetical protein
MPGAKGRFQRVGERALLGAERAAEGLMHQPGMQVCHATRPSPFAARMCVLNLAFE